MFCYNNYGDLMKKVLLATTNKDKVKEIYKILLHKPKFNFNKMYTTKTKDKQEVHPSSKIN